MDENVTRPATKARWGWQEGENGTIVPTGEVGGEKAERDTFAKAVQDPVENRGNGGGSSTIKDLKEQLDAKGIEYKASASKAELQTLLDESEDGKKDGESVTL